MLWISARFYEMDDIEKVITSKNVFFKYLFSSSINIVNVQGIKPTATSLLVTTRNKVDIFSSKILKMKLS